MKYFCTSIILLQTGSCAGFTRSFIATRDTINNDIYSRTSFMTYSNTFERQPIRMSDEWADFADLDDDDLPSFTVADENDPQEFKAEVGEMYAPPEVFSDAAPIFLPQGSVLELTEENVEGVLAACREEIGTLFGYSAENRGVGITGGVDFLYLDGPMVVLSLKGRFWHQRPTVLERVGAYIMGRIPEVIGKFDNHEAQFQCVIINTI